MSVLGTVLENIHSSPQKGATKLVALDGRGGSGKSQLARQLMMLDSRLKLIELDVFPCSPSEHPYHRTGTQTRLNTDRLQFEALIPLRDGKPASFQVTFWWETHETGSIISVPPGGTVLVEGCYSLLTELRMFYDYSVWVECPASEAMERAIARDGENIRLQWEAAYFINEERYVKAHNPRGFADLVVHNSGDTGFRLE